MFLRIFTFFGCLIFSGFTYGAPVPQGTSQKPLTAKAPIKIEIKQTDQGNAILALGKEGTPKFPYRIALIMIDDEGNERLAATLVQVKKSEDVTTYTEFGASEWKSRPSAHFFIAGKSENDKEMKGDFELTPSSAETARTYCLVEPDLIEKEWSLEAELRLNPQGENKWYGREHAGKIKFSPSMAVSNRDALLEYQQATDELKSLTTDAKRAIQRSIRNSDSIRKERLKSMHRQKAKKKLSGKR